MEVMLGLAQIRRHHDIDELTQIRDYCQRAARVGVDILVFPEMLMTPYNISVEEYANCAESVSGPFATAVNDMAKEFGLWIVYTMNEKNPAGRPFNTLVITGSDGVRRRQYRKAHLFDANTTRESEKMASGDALMEPVDSPFGKLGAAICYDLRFPEAARYASLRGADLFFYPSAWYDGEGKLEQWRALLSARAIENEMIVVGVCRAENACTGHSLVALPNGTIAIEADQDEQLLVCKVDTEAIDTMRQNIPVMKHRREDLYRIRPGFKLSESTMLNDFVGD